MRLSEDCVVVIDILLLLYIKCHVTDGGVSHHNDIHISFIFFSSASLTHWFSVLERLRLDWSQLMTPLPIVVSSSSWSISSGVPFDVDGFICPENLPQLHQKEASNE